MGLLSQGIQLVRSLRVYTKGLARRATWGGAARALVVVTYTSQISRDKLQNELNLGGSTSHIVRTHALELARVRSWLQLARWPLRCACGTLNLSV